MMRIALFFLPVCALSCGSEASIVCGAGTTNDDGVCKPTQRADKLETKSPDELRGEIHGAIDSRIKSAMNVRWDTARNVWLQIGMPCERTSHDYMKATEPLAQVQTSLALLQFLPSMADDEYFDGQVKKWDSWLNSAVAADLTRICGDGWVKENYPQGVSYQLGIAPVPD